MVQLDRDGDGTHLLEDSVISAQEEEDYVSNFSDSDYEDVSQSPFLYKSQARSAESSKHYILPRS